jgi:3-oxoacyl-[acyl-carrier protein] reductase
MNMGLKDKVILVAGASYGIGFDTALQLAEEGAKVSILGRDTNRLQIAKNLISERTGITPFSIQGDITKKEDCLAFVQESAQHFGQIDGLVVAAGSSKKGKLHEVGDDDWDLNWRLNVLSVYHLVQETVPFLKQRPSSKIVVVGSASAKQPSENQLISNVTKAGILTFVKTLATELADHNICINNVCPGKILSDRRRKRMQQEAVEKGISLQEAIDELSHSIPLKRLGEPSEVAALIVFLLSKHGSYMTGQSLTVDGGLIKSII